MTLLVDWCYCKKIMIYYLQLHEPFWCEIKGCCEANSPNARSSPVDVYCQKLQASVRTAEALQLFRECSGNLRQRAQRKKLSLPQGENWAHRWWQDSNAQGAFLQYFYCPHQVHCWSKLYGILLCIAFGSFFIFERSRYIFLKHSSSTWLQLRLIWVEMSVKNHKVRQFVIK